MKVSIFALSTILLFSCSQKRSVRNNITTPENLLSQFFSVDINKDNTLLTGKGTIINIPKGALQSDSSIVKLEIKEALNNTDIVLAGLTTMSGNQALSSGGMVYFNAASGYKVEIKKNIEILLPTNTYNRDMQVYKGEDKDGKIDWVDPTPLPSDATTLKIDEGEKLFKASCASCHKIDKDFTGPSLLGITNRKSKAWFYYYTNHVFGDAIFHEISDTSLLPDSSHNLTFDPEEAYLYHLCMRKKWGSEMTSFQLKNKELEALYSYIKSETDKIPWAKDAFKEGSCCDSCVEYHKALNKANSLNYEREALISNNGDYYDLERPSSTSIAPDLQDTIQTSLPEKKKVAAINKPAVYYTINITATGWYNVDILIKNYSSWEQSELFVRLKGEYKIDFNVSLIIPSSRVFVEGGKLDDNTQYGFDDADGKIKLPQNEECTIIATAENGDNILFGKASFNAQLKQTVELSITQVTKEGLLQQLKSLQLDDVKVEVKDTKNVDKIRVIDKELKETQKLKPKNCNCDFPEIVSSLRPMAINTK